MDANDYFGCRSAPSSAAREIIWGWMKTGEPFFLPITEKYKEAVKWMHNLYRKGLIDPEHFTQNTSMYTSKVQATAAPRWGIFSAGRLPQPESMRTSSFRSFPYRVRTENRYVESDRSFLDMSGYELCVTTNCENVELLLKWADEFYTDLVGVQTYYGSIPDQIKENEDGTYELVPPSDKDISYDYVAWSNSLRDFGPKYVSQAFQDAFILPADGGDGEKLQMESLYKDCVMSNFPVVQYKAGGYLPQRNVQHKHQLLCGVPVCTLGRRRRRGGGMGCLSCHA